MEGLSSGISNGQPKKGAGLGLPFGWDGLTAASHLVGYPAWTAGLLRSWMGATMAGFFALLHKRVALGTRHSSLTSTSVPSLRVGCLLHCTRVRSMAPVVAFLSGPRLPSQRKRNRSGAVWLRQEQNGGKNIAQLAPSPRRPPIPPKNEKF